MSEILIIAGIILLGWVIGYLFQWLVEKAEGVPMGSFDPGSGAPNLAIFLYETFYFACLFSVPLSGNLPLTFIMLSFFLYALFGSFGGTPKYASPDEEDKVTSKWYRMFP